MRGRWLLALALATSVVAQPWKADACGGCFAPPGAVQVVTDHRMILSLSSTQTTLWDQFTFAGDPSEFSWILPIHYDPAVQIRIADDRFMTLVDNVSAPVMVQPPPPPYQFCGQYPGPAQDGGIAFADAASAADVVQVYREESVGPYAVAIVGGADPMAIRDWMTANGYFIPDSVAPVIDAYASQHMDFLALKLRPATGLNRIAPVRISMPGYQPALPLRMIAAGVGDKVNLVLMVIAAARIEAQNFPNGEVSEDSLTYDYDHPTSLSTDYLTAFTALNAASGNRLWLTESSTDQAYSSLESLAVQATYGMPRDAGSDCADGGLDDAGMPVMSTCAPPDPREDLQTAFVGLGSAAQITRMRASLGADALDRDLLLQASDLGLRDRYYHYGHLLNMPTEAPPCPDSGTTSYDSGSLYADVATPPSQRVDAGRTTDAHRADGSSDGGVPTQLGGGCNAGRAGDPAGISLIGLALGALAMRRRRGRREV